MRKELCPNHHYYDGEKYASCPFCAKEGKGTEPAVIPDPVTEPISGTWKDKIPGRKKGKSSETRQPGEEPSSGTVQPQSESDSVSVTVQAERNGIPPVQVEQKNETVHTKKPDESSSLKNELGKVNKGNEPKTMSYWGNNISDDPVAGWFACIGGPCVGTTYEIYSGKNGIGRKMIKENKIVIQQDGKISGTKHTTVMYDPKGRKFYLLPAEGSGTVYLNEAVALNAVELNDRDVLEIGDTKLMLVPLCGPDFTWEDWMETDKK